MLRENKVILEKAAAWLSFDRGGFEDRKKQRFRDMIGVEWVLGASIPRTGTDRS